MNLCSCCMFCSTTLTDPDLVNLMHENDFLVWGGDIRDRDAWSGTYLYLFVALSY